MRLGGAAGGGDPLTMGTGNDYAELCDLGPSRWSSRGYHPPHSTSHHPTSASATHIRSNSFEAEDITGTYGSARVGSSTNSLRGRTGIYYSPPGTSYTIVERPHSPHYYYNTAGVPSKGGISSTRGTTYGSSSHITSISSPQTTSTTSRLHNGKKRPISPEQVLRLFGTTTTTSSSSSVPTSNHLHHHHQQQQQQQQPHHSHHPHLHHHQNSNGLLRDRGRRSPASSPPSTTHQIYRDRERERERDRSVPNIHELSTRTISMTRDQQDGHNFGICVKGGKETGLGIFISRIEEGSLAERAGLRPGDLILDVNGTSFTSINHDDALKRCTQILKSSRQINMTIRTQPILNSAAPLHGFDPPLTSLKDPSSVIHQSTTVTSSRHQQQHQQQQTHGWVDRYGRPTTPPPEYGGRNRKERHRRVELSVDPGQSLGLMIRGGSEYRLGIFVSGVDKDSVSHRAGIQIGDQLVELNGQLLSDLSHDEAVNQLKNHKRMSLIVRDVGKIPHMHTTAQLSDTCDPYSTSGLAGTRCIRKHPTSVMVEEKAKSMLPRHHFGNLLYYIAEYTLRGMTIDAFVTVLLEMLDTPEKHTLVTEIRELVFPEDRVRYDDLVYSRDPYTNGRTDRYNRVSDVDLEVMAATGKNPSDDSGLTDIRLRPPVPLPYRPMSAGPILHHQQQHYLHYASNKHLGGGSQNDIPRNLQSNKSGIYDKASGSTGGGGLKEYGGCDDVRSRRGSETQLTRTEYSQDTGGYFGGIRSHIGGLTQRVKSWYCGRPLDLATKLSRSFDMKEDGNNGIGDKSVRRHQSMQRLSAEQQNGSNREQNHEHNPNVVPDSNGNLRVTVRKTKSSLGIAFEGGKNTKHPIPRIININDTGCAYEAGGLQAGQLIMEVNGINVSQMEHEDVARIICESFQDPNLSEIVFVVVEAKKSNLEPKPTALIFLEA